MQTNEEDRKRALSGTLKQLEEQQFVKQKEMHKIDGKIEEDAALREVIGCVDIIAMSPDEQAAIA